MREGYDTAQVCNNGHIITAYYNTYGSQQAQKRCVKCGESTIIACEHCCSQIRGYYHTPGVSCPSPRTPPAYCHECGQPYPWTERKTLAALELFAEILDMEQEQQEELERDLAAISTENPRTQVAAVKVGRWIGKAGKEGAGMLRDVLVDIVSETAKKVIWPEIP